MDWPTIINLAASIATAVGVVVAAIGLWLTKVQAKTAYEDSIGNEYRQIVKQIPVARVGRNRWYSAVFRRMADATTSGGIRGYAIPPYSNLRTTRIYCHWVLK
jgi:hypothetical protein